MADIKQAIILDSKLWDILIKELAFSGDKTLENFAVILHGRRPEKIENKVDQK